MNMGVGGSQGQVRVESGSFPMVGLGVVVKDRLVVEAEGMVMAAAATQQRVDGPWAVETKGLTKRFGENVAVNGVDLRIPRGCAFGYLGPNGAGKTTLIRVLLGLTHADAGSMWLLGHPVPRHRDVALARVAAIVDEPRFHAHLSGRQNLQVLAAA